MGKTVIKEKRKKVTCIFSHQYAIMFISGDANERSNSVDPLPNTVARTVYTVFPPRISWPDVSAHDNHVKILAN